MASPTRQFAWLSLLTIGGSTLLFGFALTYFALLDAPDGPLRNRFQQIITDTDRLRDRMRALLDFGRRVEQRRVPTALDGVIQQTLEPVRSRCAAQHVRLEVAVPSDLPKVRLDPARFEEALLCLVGNALDAMPQGGVQRVAVVPASDPAGGAAVLPEFVVEDTGRGMPPAVLARAFEPFFTTKPHGSGLGLRREETP